MQSDHCKAKEVGCLEDSSPQTVAFLRSIASMLRQESSRSTARSAFKKVHCQRRATLRATVFKEELTPPLNRLLKPLCEKFKARSHGCFGILRSESLAEDGHRLTQLP